MVTLLILLALITLASRVMEQARGEVDGLFQRRITNHVKMLIAEKASSLDLAFFENVELQNQLSVATTEATFRPMLIMNQLNQAVAACITLVSTLLIIVLWRAWIVPVVLGAEIVNFVFLAHSGGARAQLALEQTPKARAAGYVYLLLTGDSPAKEVRLFGLRPYFLARLRTLLETIYRRERRLASTRIRWSVLIGGACSVVRPALIAYVAFEALHGMLSLGGFTLYMQALAQLEGGVIVLMYSLAHLYENHVFLTSLFRFLALQPEVEAPRSGGGRHAPAPTITPRIEFCDVSFRYPGTNHDILKHISLCIEPGEIVALVGENGAGKTTLVKLLAGLYEPTAGQILLNGVNMRGLDRASLRAHLSVTFQDYNIYHFTARENIGIGHAERQDESGRIEEAARRSGFDTIVAHLPHQYETVLGRYFEQGHELSGGQRQLAALARALVRDASVLVLDEPAAALDTRSEQRFFEQLARDSHARRQSVIFISHRFSTVRRAHRILVVEHGELVEEGSHQRLLARGGRYAEMFTAQRALYGDAGEEASAEDTPEPWSPKR
jgi:ATP-binding cassette subfamily B protein